MRSFSFVICGFFATDLSVLHSNTNLVQAAGEADELVSGAQTEVVQIEAI